MTHYATLGVAETATADEIKRAYRSLASKHHPDKGGDTQKFQEIQAAYSVLEDANRRAQYDQERRNPGGGFRFNVNGQDFDGMPPGMEDIFSRFNFNFGGQANPFFNHNHQQRRNKDIKAQVTVSLVDTLQDQTKTLSVQTTNGHREHVEVNIPRGVTTGTQIKYSGLGDNFFNTLPRGDLYIVFNVTAHEHFQPNGIDLHSQARITCFQAILGGEFTVHGLDGTEFTLSIPPGTQPGTRLRIKNEGLYAVNQPQRGNLIIELHVTVPTDLTQQQIDLVKQIQLNQ